MKRIKVKKKRDFKHKHWAVVLIAVISIAVLAVWVFQIKAMLANDRISQIGRHFQETTTSGIRDSVEFSDELERSLPGLNKSLDEYTSAFNEALAERNAQRAVLDSVASGVVEEIEQKRQEPPAEEQDPQAQDPTAEPLNESPPAKEDSPEEPDEQKPQSEQQEPTE